MRETKTPHTSQIRNKKRRVRGADSFCSFLMGNGWRAGVGANRDVHRRELMTGPVTHPLARSRLVKILQVHLAFVGFRSRTTLTSTFSRRYQDTSLRGSQCVPPGGKDGAIVTPLLASAVEQDLKLFQWSQLKVDVMCWLAMKMQGQLCIAQEVQRWMKLIWSDGRSQCNSGKHKTKMMEYNK